MDTFTSLELSLWSRGLKLICGVDEAGRGPLAGPVVAAAVVFNPDTMIPGVADSKRLSPHRRMNLTFEIREKALCWAIGVKSAGEIDRLNILEATRLAMKSAVGKLSPTPDFCLVDGYPIPGWKQPHEGVIKGDNKCFTIAAASILAKVHRDELMCELHQSYPQYGFDRHKGYPTEAHRRALSEHGPCPVHRLSFRLLPKDNWK